MNPFPYRIAVHWSEPDEAYVALVPAIPGAGGDGETAEEAVRLAQESALEVLEVMKAHGDPIPQPETGPQQFSGQLRIRMPKSLHRELAEAAQREGVSLNQLMVVYLAKQLQGQGATVRPVEVIGYNIAGVGTQALGVLGSESHALTARMYSIQWSPHGQSPGYSLDTIVVNSGEIPGLYREYAPGGGAYEPTTPGRRTDIQKGSIACPKLN